MKDQFGKLKEILDLEMSIDTVKLIIFVIITILVLGLCSGCSVEYRVRLKEPSTYQEINEKIDNFDISNKVARKD